MLTGPCAERFPQGLSYSPARSHGAGIADKHPRPRETDPLALGHTPGVSMGGFECILSSNRTHGPCTTLQIGTRGSQGRPGGCQGTVETAEGCPDGLSPHTPSASRSWNSPRPLFTLDDGSFHIGLCSLNLIPLHSQTFPLAADVQGLYTYVLTVSSLFMFQMTCPLL